MGVIFTIYDEYKTRAMFEVSQYHKETSLTIDWNDIDTYNHELGKEILTKPHKCLRSCQKVINKICTVFDDEFQGLVQIRINNLPLYQQTTLKKLGKADIGELVKVDGQVLKVWDSYPRITALASQCNAGECSKITYVPQDTLILQSPKLCDKDRGGCGSYSNVAMFKPLLNKSEYVNHQKIILQEPLEMLRDGKSPRKIEVILENDLCDKVINGDQITITGIFETRLITVGNKQSTITQTFIQAVHVDVKNDTRYEDITFSKDDIEKIKELSQNPEIYNKAIGTLAPSIFGYDDAKLSLIIQLFGGVTSQMPDLTVNRGRIHSVLLGDPGTGKSNLLEAWYKLAPRGLYITGKGVSGPGLAGAVKRTNNMYGGDQYDVEAGALVLATGGCLALDEFSDLEKSDKSYLNECLERGTVTLFKADVRQCLPADTTLAIAGNPIKARFTGRTAEIIIDEMDIPSDILSRLDFIILYFDEFEKDIDDKISEHMIRNRMLGQMITNREYNETEDHDENISMLSNARSPAIDPDFFRKYIAYANINCFPVLTEKASKILKTFFLEVRESAFTPEANAIPVTRRFLGSLLRISEAFAKIRLSDTIEEKDAIQTRELIFRTLSQLFPDGVINWGVIDTGLTKKDRDTIKAIEDMSETFTRSEIRQKLIETGHSVKRIDKCFSEVNKLGLVFYEVIKENTKQEEST